MNAGQPHSTRRSSNHHECNESQQLNQGIAMNPNAESPQAGNLRANKISSGDSASISESTDKITATALVAGVHVVVVTTSAGKFRRRVYFNLPNAQRAVDRATMSGHTAHIILCQIIPANGGEAL